MSEMNQPTTPTPAEAQETQFVTIPLADFITLTQAAALLSVVVNDDTYHHQAVPAVKTTLENLVQNHEAGAAE